MSYIEETNQIYKRVQATLLELAKKNTQLKTPYGVWESGSSGDGYSITAIVDGHGEDGHGEVGLKCTDGEIIGYTWIEYNCLLCLLNTLGY